METKTGVSAGVWRVVQNGSTLEMTLTKFGHVVARWPGERLYTFKELDEILLRKSYEMRGGKDGGISVEDLG